MNTIGNEYYGRVITAVAFENDEILLTLDGATTVSIRDQGQSCCESRYMHTDDNPGRLVGKRLLGIEIVEGPGVEADTHEYHDIEFLKVRADHEVVTFSTHNEHNGYYGGFCIQLEVVK